MRIIMECIGCREKIEFDEYVEFPLCDPCKKYEKERHEQLQEEIIKNMTCSQCGYVGVAIDNHHIHGRKNSNITIRVCSNCHREIHAELRKI